MLKVSEFIVNKRKAFYMIFVIALAFCIAWIPKVKVNNNIASYLPSTTETKKGLNIMEEEFVTYAATKVMVSNITYDTAVELKEKMLTVEGVKDIVFDNDREHYKSSNALYEVSLDYTDESMLDKELDTCDAIREMLSEYDVYVYSDTIDDMPRVLNEQMKVIISLAVLTVVAVLLFTSRSFMEVPVYLVVFGTAALLNMGTNYLMGEISFITKSIAVCLQLALAIDYSIILSHRFTEEKENGLDKHDAIVEALSKAIVEISSSSLTTVSGLAALIVMQLQIGRDMGLVMCKAILFSLICVFFLMPGLLLGASDLIDKTAHRSFVPKITLWCNMVLKTRHIVPFVFAVVAIAGAVFSNMTAYSFDVTDLGTTRPTYGSISQEKINEAFGMSHQMAVVVPGREYDIQGAILSKISELDHITSATGLANTEAKNGVMITDRLNAREFAEMMEMDYSSCKVLYRAYGVDNEQYGAIFNDINDYRVCVIDMIKFVHDQMDYGVINLDEDDEQELNDNYNDLLEGQAQLEGDNWSRLVFTYDVPVESEEAYRLIEQVHEITDKYYPDTIVACNTVNARDLKGSFGVDNLKISILTALAVLIILMFTFSSVSLPVILVATIQSSIWINFTVPYLTGEALYFIAYLIVSSIQMGATIDYAIVVTNRYVQLREDGPLNAARESLEQAFPTILTSGFILCVIGMLIGVVSTEPIISGLGICLGRGTFVSIMLVMIVLPQLLIMFDKIIGKSFFDISSRIKVGSPLVNKKGIIYANGRINGYVCGYIDGEFNGLIRGDINARVKGGSEDLEDESEKTAE